MGLVLLINSEKSVRRRVKTAFEQRKPSGYSVKMVANQEKALESLNFELPEVVLINCNDPQINYREIVEAVQKDAWLHSFGMIGVYDSQTQDERSIITEFGELNLLVMLDKSRLVSHLSKSVSIILENRQLIFQRELATHLSSHSSGSFEIDNDPLAVPIYAGIAVTSLMQQGYLASEHKFDLQMALAELMINAIEHGNCGITYEEKNAELSKGKSVVDIILERCTNPEVAAKRVHFEWESRRDSSAFIIRDQGKGFNVQKVRGQIEQQDQMRPHGRGIKMAEYSGAEIQYNETGNEVQLIFQHPEYSERGTPEGFADEEVLFTKSEDVVFREGEKGDFLYYISSGHFTVTHSGKVVGELSPADVFMGEMSFLLNNRRSATVTADKNGKLVRVSRKSFVQAMKNYPHYGIFLSKLLAHKLTRSNTQLTQLSS